LVSGHVKAVISLQLGELGHSLPKQQLQQEGRLEGCGN